MRKRWRSLAALAALLFACSPEYQVLRTVPGEAGSPSSEGPGGLAGIGGLPGSGGSSGGGEMTGGAETAGEGGISSGGTAMSTICASHLDCGAGTVCSSSQCVACPQAPSACPGPCGNGFQPVLADYNGCALCECAPVSECTSDAGCPAGEQCYPGSQCEPGCSDPSCCSGNRCSAVGCAGSPIPHCLAAGCRGGARCLAACGAVSCECDGAAWQCAESPSEAGAPNAVCLDACVSP